MQAFSGKPKLEVRVPHARGLPMTDHIKYGEEAESMQWIGVDLDGTLAQADPLAGLRAHRETHSQYDETGQNLVGTRIPREDRHGAGSRA